MPTSFIVIPTLRYDYLLAVTFHQLSSHCVSSTTEIRSLWLKSPVCLDKREDNTNFSTVNCIATQRENPQNLFNEPTSNSSKEDSAVSFATKHYIKDVTSSQQVREMMQVDYSELYYTQNIPGTEKSESVEDKYFCNTLTTNIHKNKKGIGRCPYY